MKNKKKKSESAAYVPPEKREKIPMRKFKDFFVLFYSNMPSVFLCNLCFALPVLVIVFVIYYLLASAAHFGVIMLTIFLGVILIYLLYAGVNAVTIEILDGKKKIPVFSTFFGTIKKFFLKFLIHSIVISLFVFIAVFSFSFYSALSQAASVYAVFFIFYVIFLCLMLFIAFHLPFITLKFNCTLTEIYSASVAMIAKNAVNNLTLASIITLIAIFCSICISFSSSVWYISLLMAAALLLVFPAFVSLMTNFFICDRVNAYLGVEEETKTAPAAARANSVRSSYGGVSQGEYVFYNGKMIKREQMEKEMAALEETEYKNEK